MRVNLRAAKDRQKFGSELWEAYRHWLCGGTVQYRFLAEGAEWGDTLYRLVEEPV